MGIVYNEKTGYMLNRNNRWERIIPRATSTKNNATSQTVMNDFKNDSQDIEYDEDFNVILDDLSEHIFNGDHDDAFHEGRKYYLKEKENIESILLKLQSSNINDSNQVEELTVEQNKIKNKAIESFSRLTNNNLTGLSTTEERKALDEFFRDIQHDPTFRETIQSEAQGRGEEGLKDYTILINGMNASSELDKKIYKLNSNIEARDIQRKRFGDKHDELIKGLKHFHNGSGDESYRNVKENFNKWDKQLDENIDEKKLESIARDVENQLSIENDRRIALEEVLKRKNLPTDFEKAVRMYDELSPQDPNYELVGGYLKNSLASHNYNNMLQELREAQGEYDRMTRNKTRPVLSPNQYIDDSFNPYPPSDSPRNTRSSTYRNKYLNMRNNSGADDSYKKIYSKTVPVLPELKTGRSRMRKLQRGLAAALVVGSAISNLGYMLNHRRRGYGMGSRE